MTITMLPAKYDNEIKSTFPSLKSLLHGKPADDIHKHVGNTIKTVSLIIGSEDETVPTLTNTGATMTHSFDTTNFILGKQSHKFSIDGAMSSGTARWDPISDTDPFPVGHPDCLILAVFLPEGHAANIISITTQLYISAAASTAESWTVSKTTFVDGWNYIVLVAQTGLAAANYALWCNIYRIRLTFVTSGAADISLQLWAHVPPKARIVFIDDGPYLEFMTNMYPMLKARNIPVTFAIDPYSMGTTGRMTWDDLATLVADGNGNSVSLHGYAMEDDNSTEALCRIATIKAMKLMAAHGYYSMWRCCFLTNTAAGHAGIDDLFPAYGSYQSTAGSGSFPAKDLRDLPRCGLHWYNTTQIDDMFSRMYNSHCIYYFYTHKVNLAGGDNDTSFAQRDYFLQKVDEGIAAGWLECTTFESMAAEAGWRWEMDGNRRCIVVPGIGGTYTRYYQP